MRTGAKSTIPREKERERGGKGSEVALFTWLFQTEEEKEDGPLILEKILFPAHFESRFWENEAKLVCVGSHNPILYRRNEQCLSVSWISSLSTLILSRLKDCRLRVYYPFPSFLP